MAKRKAIENKDYIAAMRDIRRSSAASPQESRNKRLRTRQTIIAQARKDAA